MDTRFAAIAGILLVGLSLFVTSLISHNLSIQTTFTGQTFAAGTGCELKSSCDACDSDQCKQLNNCRLYSVLNVRCEYRDESNNLIVATPPANLGPTLPQGAQGCLVRNTCNSAITLIRYGNQYKPYKDWCKNFCDGGNPTNTPNPAASSTPTPTQAQSTPAPSCPTRIGGGLTCNPDNDCCASGFFCKKGDPSFCLSLTVQTPTPGPRCLPAGNPDGDARKRNTKYGCNNPNFPDGNPCCAPQKCRVVRINNPGEDNESADIACDPPSPTPSPSPTLAIGTCGDGCTKNADCRSGQGTCKNKDNPSQPPSEDFCRRNPGKCICAINSLCTPENPNECWCLNINNCPGIGTMERKFCGLICDEEGCLTLPACPSGLKCVLFKDQTYGKCKNDFCPSPSATPTPPYFYQSDPENTGRSNPTQREQRVREFMKDYPGLTRDMINQLPYSAKVDFGIN